MLNGIDISSWQGDMNLTEYPLDFVIVKATEGTTYINSWCDKKVQEAKEQGLLFGFYHYADGEDSWAEADFFVDNCINYFHDGIPVLDFEGEALERGANWAISFLERVEQRTGVKPMIYMSQSITRWPEWEEAAKEYGLWVALYPNVTAPDFSYAPEFPTDTGQWEFPAIWQYASDGFGWLDVNHAYMTREAWGKYAGWQEDEQPIANEKPVTQAVLENEDYKIIIERK